MSRIAIVVGHPRVGTFCEALGRSYVEGARRGGHQADLFVAGAMHFDPILRTGFSQVQALEPDLQALHDAILAADHLVFIFPLWLGGMPAILKGLLERVLQPEMVEQARQKRFVRLLKGKSARIIVTMGMPVFLYRGWFRMHEIKMLKRNILGWMGVSPIRVSMFGSIEAVGGRCRRARWLHGVGRMGKRAV